jgi:hypothetical protein
VRGKKIALLGLAAFKPNTDDMRDARSLVGDGAKLHAYDPESMAQARPLMPEVPFHDNAYSALEGADALGIVTEWDAFRALDLDRAKSLLKQPIIVELRNVYRPGDVRKRGFSYVSVERRGEDQSLLVSEAPAKALPSIQRLALALPHRKALRAAMFPLFIPSFTSSNTLVHAWT